MLTALLCLTHILLTPGSSHITPHSSHITPVSGLAGGGPSGPLVQGTGALSSRDRSAIANSIPTPVIGKNEVGATLTHNTHYVDP